MSETSSGSILRIVLHPATTIVFAIVGVILGIVVIRNSAKEESMSAYRDKTYSEQVRDINDLKSEVSALQIQDKNLQKTVEGLRERLAAVESKLPAKRKQADKKQTGQAQSSHHSH
jgi:peptidoglycan hydrolase CwlO-like protein